MQELRNLALWARPPRLRLAAVPPSPLPRLPDPLQVAARLRGTAFEAQVRELAPQIHAHRFPMLGLTIQTGPEIAWRRDYLSGRETPPDYLRLVPYLDATRAGDHKIIWELNRHQHLVLLAQAFLFTGDRSHLDEIKRQLTSWMEANPFQRGINWASALEVAFRALSWIWIYHFVGGQFSAEFRRLFLESLDRHGRHLEVNLSFYFSPNTHLLGEAVALHALGVLFPQFPRAAQWRELGGRVTREQRGKQVRADGAHFEQSTYYHVYALDLFRFHETLDAPLHLGPMQEFLHAVMGPARRLPFFGDDDGGRFFHPYGPRDRFGARGLASLWWAGESLALRDSWRSQIFRDSGLAVMTEGPVHCVIDAGPFGPWNSGHSHSDTLSLTLRLGGEDILIDAGTYTYVGDPQQRDWFRGSSAHNTVRIDERDQAIPAGPFGWREQPAVEILDWKTDAKEDFLRASCAYGGFRHVRSVRFEKPSRMVIQDEITGPPGDHLLEQFWHFGTAAARERFAFDPAGELSDYPSWASSALGEKHPSPAVRVAVKRPLPLTLTTEIGLTCPAG